MEQLLSFVFITPQNCLKISYYRGLRNAVIISFLALIQETHNQFGFA
jgi:hypothetical protein